MKTSFIIATVLLSGSLFAQWNPNTSINTPVAALSGKQNDARILEDQHGGAFIAWKDARNGNNNPDIYLQRVDSAGYPKWTTNGIAICNDTLDQSTPNLISDMAGGVIVAWTDKRTNTERDVYVQRVDFNGNILWTTNGLPVANKPNREHNEKIISDDAGGAIIAWEQFDTANFIWDVWLQRINSSGNVLWTTGGIPVCSISSNKLNPKLQKDKKGGAIITWQDFRNGFDYDIYAQRIDAYGNYKWNSAGVIVASNTGAQINPKIDPDSSSGGVYIAWQDKRNGLDYDIYAQRLDSNGLTLWTPNGVAACNAILNQSAVDIISNTVINGVILVWKDSRGGNEDIYAQKLNANGSIAWTNNGELIATSPYAQINPNICSDGVDGAIITWQDSTVNDWDIYTQKLNGNGVAQWQTNGVIVSNSIEIQSHPKNIPDGMGGSIYTWQDKRSGFYDIYCHHIYADGSNVGINEKNISASSVFPNPFQNRFILKNISEEQITLIQLRDLNGREINFHLEKLSNSGNNFVMDTGDIPSGIYLLTVQSKNKCETIKLVKQ